MPVRNIYLLTLTDAADRITPSYECNFAFVIVAGSPKEAREHAAGAVIDEPMLVWERPEYSTCSKIGVCTNARTKSGIIVREDNAS